MDRATANTERTESIAPVGGRGARTLGSLHTDAVRIYVEAAALRDILEFSAHETSHERGGFLIGQHAASPQPQIAIRQFLPAREVRSGATMLTFTHETWATLNRDAQRRFPRDVILGWHHTHPNLGIFLSAWDRFIHRHFFAQPWHVALVVDPVRREMGFFQWRRGEIVDCGFVYLRPPAPASSAEVRRG
jgi:proteasome lid subunit RPN8/RPN11